MHYALTVLAVYAFIVAFIFSRKPGDIRLTWRRSLLICVWPYLLARQLLREHRAR